jgi:hypothetical protein
MSFESWKLLSGTTKVAFAPFDPVGGLKALKELETWAELPIRFKSVDSAEYPVKVPQGFESLFKSITIDVTWERSGKAARVQWGYNHPGGGSNGYSIGWVIFDDRKQQWGWRLEDGQYGMVD